MKLRSVGTFGAGFSGQTQALYGSSPGRKMDQATGPFFSDNTESLQYNVAVAKTQFKKNGFTILVLGPPGLWYNYTISFWEAFRLLPYRSDLCVLFH